MKNKNDKWLIYIYLFGLIVLFLNDCYWKYQYHNWITGKLSDFVGLFIFPIFLYSLIGKYKKLLITLIGIGFILWKMPIMDKPIQWWNSISTFQLQRTIDYTDYAALISLLIAYKAMSLIDFNHLKKITFKNNEIIRYPIILFSIIVFCSTSKMKPNYPKGDILINESYSLEYPKDSIIEKLSNFNIRIDSTYADKFNTIEKSYYQIPILIINKGSENDTIRDINFHLYCDDWEDECDLFIINCSVEDNWKLQDWRELKRRKKVVKRIIENRLIEIFE